MCRVPVTRWSPIVVLSCACGRWLIARTRINGVGRSDRRQARRVEHGLPHQRSGGGRVSKGRRTARFASRSGSRARAAASRSSAAARPTSATPRGRSARPRSTACQDAGINFIELPIAYDGIAIVVNPKAAWINDITVDELKNDLGARGTRQGACAGTRCGQGWPDREIHLFGAGVDSGTYDYFTEAINGKAKAQPRRLHVERGRQRAGAGRRPATSSRSASFRSPTTTRTRARLKLIPVDDKKADNGNGPIAPSLDTIRTGTYQPLARPLFIYVSDKALARPEVQQFVDFFLTNVAKLAEEVGYVELGDAGLPTGRRALQGAQDRHRLRRGQLAGRRDHRAAPRQRTFTVSREQRTDARTGRRVGHRARAVSVRGALGVHHRRHHLVLAVETIGFLREVSVVEFLTGTEWTPLFAEQALRRAAARRGHGARVGDRDGGGAADGAAERDLPERVRAAGPPARRQAHARDSRRRADGRLRLLRADVRHAAPAADSCRSSPGSTRSARAS